MKVLLLSDTNSEHTEKWALGLAGRGIQVGLFSFNRASYEWYNHGNITVFFEPEKKINAESTLTKLAYLKYVTILKKIIKHFKPDILHAHYATSYGLVGALSGFHPFIISSWGTDVMRFPDKNFVAKSILKYNFKNADILCATSETIKEYINKVSPKDVTVIPFGIDIKKFRPEKKREPLKKEILLGSIKPLESLYNINIIIKSLAGLKDKYPGMKLMIVGEGGQSDELKEIAQKEGVADKVIFTGRVPFSEVNKYFNKIDILLNLSQYESFGVSVIEAMACGAPVIVTGVGGLKEIVKDDTLGLKVEVGNVEQTMQAIEKLIKDPQLYQEVSANGRKHVEENYNWEENLARMITVYNEHQKVRKK